MSHSTYEMSSFSRADDRWPSDSFARRLAATRLLRRLAKERHLVLIIWRSCARRLAARRLANESWHTYG